MRGTIKHTKIKSINARLFCVFATIIACLFICFSLAFASANKAYAAAGTGTFTIEQSLTSKQGQDMDQTYSYTFEAVDKGAPMPTSESEESGKYVFEITGSTSVSFDIAYSVPGQIYKYKVYMNVPAAKEYYTFDTTVYDISVWTSSSESSIIIYYNPDGDKLIEPPCFNIVYDEPGPGPGPEPTPTPTPTPDPTRPPQTLDAATIFMIFVGFVVLFAVGLFMYSQGKKKKQ